MVAQFIENPRFPDTISYGSSGGPGFKTHIWEGNTGVEVRSKVWSKARGRWTIIKGVQDKADMDELRAWFYNLSGRATGFRFKDWSDYEVYQSVIGAGDADGKRVFPIIKAYKIGAYTYTRRIFKPRTDGGAPAPVVRVAGVIVSPTTYSINATTGVLTFNITAAPADGAAVDITCEYDVPARLDTDSLEASHDGWQLESWQGVGIVELLEEDFT